MSKRYFNKKRNIMFSPNNIQNISVNTINNNFHILQLFQIGHNAGTYLPNLLTKFLNVSNVRYTYTWANPSSQPMLLPENVDVLNHDGIESYVLDFPINNIYNGTWIVYWCDDIIGLSEFYTRFKKVYRCLYNDFNWFRNHFYIIIPSLSVNGASVSILHKESTINKTLVKNIENNWCYDYGYDMLATMHMYNISIEKIFKPYITTTNKNCFYQNIGGNGVDVFDIDQELHNIIAYDIKED